MNEIYKHMSEKEKAEEEGVALITTDLSAYHVAGRMHEKGIA